MEGYDKTEALAWMKERFDPKACPRAVKRLDEYLRAAIEADFAYMEKSGVLEGRAYYDDDDAFEMISDLVARQIGAKDDSALNDVEDFVDQYMELQQSFMEEKGLLGWD